MVRMRDKLYVLALTSALLFGGIVHASFSHSHGAHSHEGESVIWAQLHSSLRHEDKKPLATMFENPLFLLFTLVAVSGAHVAYRSRDGLASVRDPFASRGLKRGILRYRVFG